MFLLFCSCWIEWRMYNSMLGEILGELFEGGDLPRIARRSLVSSRRKPPRLCIVNWWWTTYWNHGNTIPA
jgi:hypothetical protein